MCDVADRDNVIMKRLLAMLFVGDKRPLGSREHIRMKRWIGSLMLAGLASVVFAQAPFTIVRPADGAKVRETVHVLIPKGSIPDGGYVGVFLGGKFLEATVPPLKGKFYDYALNTKALGLADTEPGKPLKLELVLYVDFNEKSRIVDRSSVDINIGNQANIPVPNAGIKLRYTFQPGTRLIYRLDQKVSISPISDVENSKGGRAAEITSDGEAIRVGYEVMNAYGDGDGLLRMQPLPEKGKDYALLTAGDQPQKKYFDYEMAPVYMRIHSTGQEVFGSIPAYTPLEGSGGSGSYTDLIGLFPLPTLPTKPVHVGDSWQSQFQEGVIPTGNWQEVETVTEPFAARGEFVDTEWEGGHPCAKIKHTIEAGSSTKEGKKLKAQGAQFSDDKISLEETIFFAMDTHQVLRVDRDMTIDRKVDNQQLGMGAGGSVGAPGSGGPGGPPMSGPGGPGGPGFSNPGGGKGDDFTGAVGNFQGIRTGPSKGGRPGMGGRMGGPGGPPGMGGAGGFPGRNGAPQQAAATFIRIRLLQTFTLESN